MYGSPSFSEQVSEAYGKKAEEQADRVASTYVPIPYVVGLWLPVELPTLCRIDFMCRAVAQAEVAICKGISPACQAVWQRSRPTVFAAQKRSVSGHTGMDIVMRGSLLVSNDSPTEVLDQIERYVQHVGEIMLASLGAYQAARVYRHVRIPQPLQARASEQRHGGS